HQHHVGGERRGPADGLLPAAAFPDDVDIGLLLQDGGQPAPAEGVVVDEPGADAPAALRGTAMIGRSGNRHLGYVGGVPTHCGIPSWRKSSRVKEIEPCCRRQNSLLHSARESQGARTGTLHRWELGNPETSRSAIPY